MLMGLRGVFVYLAIFVLLCVLLAVVMSPALVAWWQSGATPWGL